VDGQRRLSRSLRVMRRRTATWLNQTKPSRRVRGIARGGSAALLLVTVGYGLIQGGHIDSPNGSPFRLADWLAGRAGYAAENIEISGLTYHRPEHVLQAIGVKPGDSLVGFDAQGARAKLENRSWVASAEVQRAYPNKLKVVVSERIPFAIWRQLSGFTVIDRSGVAMRDADFSRLKHLPLVTGEGANTEAAALMDALADVPELLIKVKGSARVGGRRWTLYLDNGVMVLLPEVKIDRALTLVSQLDASQKILSKAVATVDLRIPRQIVVTALPGSLEQAALAAREEAENQ
jgi:cell division protein FtsQ